MSGSELNSPIVDSNNIVKVQNAYNEIYYGYARHKHVDLVKMNIEGSEFAVLLYRCWKKLKG